MTDGLQVTYDNKNYTAILKSECSSLIELVNAHIETYLDNIYFDIETNVNEEESSYIELLNNKNIALNRKTSLIKKIITRITVLSNIKDTTLYPILFLENKIIPTWNNLLLYYNLDGQITDQMIVFLNNLENTNELSSVRMETKVNDKNIFSKLCSNMITCDKINNENFDLLLKSVPWWYDEININNLSIEKVKSLIVRTIISSTVSGYQLIKEYSNDLIILFVENRKSKILEIVDQIEWDSNDLNQILKSNKITNSEKKKFIDNSKDAITDSKENLSLVTNLILGDMNFIISDDIIKTAILERGTPAVNRIQLFNKYSSLIISLDDFIDSLSGDYLEISDKSKRAKLDDTQYHRRFLDILKNKNYIASYSDKSRGLRVYHSTKEE